MKLVFTKKVANIFYEAISSDGSIILNIDGEHIRMRPGDTFTLMNDLVVRAPKNVMPFIRESYREAGYKERSLN